MSGARKDAKADAKRLAAEAAGIPVRTSDDARQVELDRLPRGVALPQAGSTSTQAAHPRAASRAGAPERSTGGAAGALAAVGLRHEVDHHRRG
jgi:hypothetical protein